MIPSVGISYAGFERLVLAADLRWVDYENTNGFKAARFDSAGALTGLGWRSVLAVAAGAQYQLTNAIAVRAGYTFNQNPIPDSVSAVNVASPALYEHILYLGGSVQLTQAFTLSLAYYHAFNFSITGPMVGTAGLIPGTSVTNDAVIDALTLGFTVTF
jgi:long-chain fatty acid transport protein